LKKENRCKENKRCNKIRTVNIPDLEKTMPIQVQETSRTPNRPDQNRATPRHIIIKTTSTETREKILKAVGEKKQITYKVNPSKSQQTSQQNH
jgi:hypothetical protein